MKSLRIALLSSLLTMISALVYILAAERHSLPFSHTLATVFQAAGKPAKTLDRAVSKIAPISAMDEKILGDEIKASFEKTQSVFEEDVALQRYLESLVQYLTKDSKKPFTYSVYLTYGPPNACAMPGGVLCITKMLVERLETEAELVAILGHEIGHIELGHLFDAARRKMLQKKYKIPATGLLDYFEMFARQTFSKAQEDEADEFSYQMVLSHGYIAYAVSHAFEKMLRGTKEKAGPTDPLSDFFTTHPYLELRIAKFRSLADRWVAHHEGVPMYVGRKNFEERRTRYDLPFLDEYHLPQSSEKA